jgi:hypothetical protein
MMGQVGPDTGALKQNIANDANLLKQQNLGSIDGRAAASGMSGSTGYRDQVTKMQDNVDSSAMAQMGQLDYNAENQNIQNQMQMGQAADMYNANAIGQGLNNQMQLANQNDQLAFAQQNQGLNNQMQLNNQLNQSQQNAMGQMGQMQQGAMSQFNPYMAQLNATNMYQQSLGPIANEGFSNSSGGGSNSSSSNNFSNGMNVGVNLGGGVTNGGSAGGSASNSNGSSQGISWAPGI